MKIRNFRRVGERYILGPAAAQQLRQQAELRRPRLGDGLAVERHLVHGRQSGFVSLNDPNPVYEDDQIRIRFLCQTIICIRRCKMRYLPYRLSGTFRNPCGSFYSIPL